MSTQASSTATPAHAASERIPVGSPVYNEIAQCLYEEAELLDQQRFDEWLAFLAEDLRYTAPLRETRAGRDQTRNIVRSTKHFDDDYNSILGRLGRLRTKSAWAEDPPSRTRRIITNILVRRGEGPEEYAVASYLFMARSRYESADYQFLSAVRNDVLRRASNGSYKLARREIIIDQSVVGMQNFAVFF